MRVENWNDQKTIEKKNEGNMGKWEAFLRSSQQNGSVENASWYNFIDELGSVS